MARVTTQTVNTGTGRKLFSGDTLEAAIAAAKAEMGPDLKVVSAKSLRRGGFAGFFATDMGVEIEVELNAGASVAPSATVATPAVPVVAGSEPGSATEALLALRKDRFELTGDRQQTTPRQTRRGADVAEIVTERINERETEATQRAELAKLLEAQARAEADEAARREADARVAAEAAAERERLASISATLDAERRRSAQLEVERDRALDVAMNDRAQAAAELVRLQNEREQAVSRANGLRGELDRAERERAAASLQADLMRDALRRGREEAAEKPVVEEDDNYGMKILSRMGVPGNIIAKVKSGVPLSKAIPVGGRVGDPTSTGGLIVLVGPRQLVLQRQMELAAVCNVREADLAFATMREVIDRHSAGVRILSTDNEVTTWVDGRLEPRRTSIIAVEWNASPGWTTGVRRVGAGAANGAWRIVLPATYPTQETRTLIGALGAYNPVLDVVGAQTSVGSCAQMLEFSDRIATVDSEPHSGALWASLLWERACRL